MAKGYIVVDIPTDCYKCRFQIYDEIMDEYYCAAKDQEDNFIAIPAGFPVWCPIKEFPDPYNNLSRFEWDDYKFAEGYNDCLNDILNNE